MNWPLENDDSSLAKIVEAMSSDGPQAITRVGEKLAVVISIDDYERLSRRKPTLVEYLLSGPEWDDEFVEMVNARDRSPPREIDFDE